MFSSSGAGNSGKAAFIRSKAPRPASRAAISAGGLEPVAHRTADPGVLHPRSGSRKHTVDGVMKNVPDERPPPRKGSPERGRSSDEAAAANGLLPRRAAAAFPFLPRIRQAAVCVATS